MTYLAVAITAFNRKPADQTCRDMELVIKDTAYAGSVSYTHLDVYKRQLLSSARICRKNLLRGSLIYKSKTVKMQ